MKEADAPHFTVSGLSNVSYDRKKKIERDYDSENLIKCYFRKKNIYYTDKMEFHKVANLIVRLKPTLQEPVNSREGKAMATPSLSEMSINFSGT